ncbi:MAG TPA: ABC transporter ATP-binding protein [Chitinophagales bacterium]|nr:ABC transporter ATP-binding protein [Chitinophagales bacterium]
MSDIVIKSENISKLYRLGNVDIANFKDDIVRLWATARGKEDPAIALAESNDRSQKADSDYVWALKDINFTVKQGDVLGVIGRNGAGKSTLLKILSKVTSPTTGSIKVKGRIASLLEVGTGFHPELTGRENMYLNGHILGMTKREIDRKFDEIVDFAGVEKYLETPVKRYSSGMYVRLAFAVAAHLEPEILIVDEVLAVGDAEFQKKCLGKMQDVSKNEGRTILFVSHNIASIRQLCTTGLLMHNGRMQYAGSIYETVDRYLALSKRTNLSSKFEKSSLQGKAIEITGAELSDGDNHEQQEFSITEPIVVKLKIHCTQKVPNLYGYITVKNKQEELFIESDTFDNPPNCLENLQVGDNEYKIVINPYILPHGEYSVYVSLTSSYSENFTVDTPGDILTFAVVDETTERGHHRQAKTSQLLKWELQNAV